MKKIGKFLLLFLILLIPFTVNAADTIEINSVRIVEKSGTMTVEDLVYDDNTLSSAIAFNQLHDFVTLELEIENNSNNDFKLDSIQNGFDENYIDVDSSFIGNVIAKGKTELVYVTITYANELINQADLGIADASIDLIFVDEQPIINPITNRHFFWFLIYMVIIFGAFYLVFRSGKKKYLVFLLFGFIPWMVMAQIGVSIRIQFHEVEVKGRFLSYEVTIDYGDGNVQTIEKTYGQTIGELAAPAKTGYEFTGWLDQDNQPVSDDTVITGEMSLHPSYNPITYNITYDLADGTVATANPTTYTVESQFTLTNPTKEGFTFSGWTEGTSDSLQTSVTIFAGTTGDKSFTAHFVADESTPYVVIHNKMKLDGTYEEAEREELTGATGSLITPQAKSYPGFIPPTETSTIIKGDGSTVVTYNYDRMKYQFGITDRTYINNVDSTIDGSYYYETEITVVAIERDGYNFRWSDGNTNYSRTFTISQNTYLTAEYTAINVTYHVIHEQMDLDGIHYTVKSDLELYGTAETYVTPVVNDYDGFNAPTAQQLYIKGDGTASLTYRYTRKQYTLTLEDSDYIDTTTPTGMYYYGTEINLKAKEREGFAFSYWSGGRTAQEISFYLVQDVTMKPFYTELEVIKYRVSFDTNGGNEIYSEMIVASGERIGYLPMPTRNGYLFMGWYTSTDSGMPIDEDFHPTADITLYAIWKKADSLCKIATTLHTETCVRTSDGCYTNGYYAGGEKGTDQISYGLLSDGSLVPGNAYDCDVNGDGVYDAQHERFYYMRMNGNNAVLMFYSNFEGESGIQTINIFSYDTAFDELPSTAQWPNITVTYDGRAARLLSTDDIDAACGAGHRNGNKGELNDCEYFFENTRFANNDQGRTAFWIEYNSNYYRVHTYYMSVAKTDSVSSNAVKPVIEVPISLIEHSTYTVTFNSMGGTAVDSVDVIRGGAIGELPTTKKDNYAFAGWYEDPNYVTPVTEETVVLGNVVYYAKWISEADAFPIVFQQNAACTFNGADGITGCSEYVGDSYIDTGIQLYSEENLHKDYEIGFTIVDYDYEGSDQETLMNTKLEGGSKAGVIFKRQASTNFFMIESKKSSSLNSSFMVERPNVEHVVIYRINDKIYYSINDANIIHLNDLSQYNPPFTLPVWFGAAPTNSTGTSARRFFTGTLSNMYIRLGTYVEKPKYVITFNPSGGSVNSGTRYIIKNDPVGTLPVPVRTGYVFIGWFTSTDSGVQVTSDTIPSSNVTYYAKWMKSIESAEIENDSISLRVDETKQIVIDNTTQIEEYTFTSNNENIATVDEEGNVTGIATGVTSISIYGLTSHTTRLIDIIVNSDDMNVDTFNGINDAMRTYYSNINNWSQDEANFQSFMTYNFNNYNCKCSDNTCNTSGDVMCDKANAYNTLKDTPLNVYLYDLSNNQRGAKVNYTDSNDGLISNMIPGQTYYWEVASDTSQNGYVTATGNRRIVNVDGVRNVRDLGGLMVDVDNDGIMDGTVKYSRLFRGTKLNSDAATVTALENLGINEEVDLRASSERGSNEVSLGYFKQREMFHYQIDYEHYPEKYAIDRGVITEVMQDIINGKNIYFHCRIGADRTGTLAYILEGLLGVNDEDRLEDYELSFFSGLINRHRFYSYDPTSSVSTTEKFVYMYNFMETNQDIYNWFMQGSVDVDADNQLIEDFKDAMIDWYETGYNTVTFNTNDGATEFETYSVRRGGKVGVLPVPEREGYTFVGWFTSTDSGIQVTSNTIPGGDVTYFAIWQENVEYICKKATSLHQYSSYTYGQLPEGDELNPGDAFDCDVDGVNGYDADHERFYYLTTEGDYAVLIYYNNTLDGAEVCGADAVAYGDAHFETGPTVAYDELPSTTQWPNVSLHSVPRQILNENGTSVVGSYTAGTFSYTGKAARFATVQEIKAATTSTLKGTNGELNNPAYYFLIENTSGHVSGCRSNYWLETPVAAGAKAWRLDGSNKKLGNANGSSAIRPVIEVPLNQIES